MDKTNRIILGVFAVFVIVGIVTFINMMRENETPIVEPSPTNTTSPTTEPTPQVTPTMTPTVEPTEKPRATPTPKPTETPQVETQPTEKPVTEPIPTVEPTPESTPQPTLEITPKPTPEPIPQSTPEPTPEPPQETGLTDEENYWLVMLERGCSHCGTNTCGGFDYANKTYNSANCDAANSLCDTCGKEIGNGQNGTCIIRESGTCYYCGAEFDGTCHTCP